VAGEFDFWSYRRNLRPELVIFNSIRAGRDFIQVVGALNDKSYN